MTDRHRALGNGVGQVVPGVDELVEALVERVEARADDAPVELLADEREVDQLEERCLKLVPGLLANVFAEGRKMCGESG